MIAELDLSRCPLPQEIETTIQINNKIIFPSKVAHHLVLHSRKLKQTLIETIFLFHRLCLPTHATI